MDVIEKQNKPKPNIKLKQSRMLRGWSQEKVAEKIGTDPKRVGIWERGESIPSPHFQEKLCELFEKNARELGFLEQEPQELVSSRHTDPSAKNILSTNNLAQNIGTLDEGIDTIDLPFHGSRDASVIIVVSNGDVSLRRVSLLEGPEVESRTNEALPIIKTLEKDTQQSSEEEMNVDRKQFLHTMTQAVGATLLSPDDLLLSELVELSERFIRAIKRPSTVNEKMLLYVEKRTDAYWQDRLSAALASGDLLSYVKDHFQKILTLLEDPLLPSLRIHLYSTASATAQLLGHLLFDMGYYAKARAFHKSAILSAQEANNPALQAVAWGRMSFTWSYDGKPEEALKCIREARRLAKNSTNTTVRAYLAAVEAEVHAFLGNPDACLKALDDAENFEEHQYSSEESYWLRFDRSRLVGYQGACYKRLYNPELPQTSSFLSKAQLSLTEALEQLTPARIQRRPTLLIDLASTFTQQMDIEAACEHAQQALTILDQTKSQMAVQRLLKLRSDLDPWKETAHVRNLDMQITPLLSSVRH